MKVGIEGRLLPLVGVPLLFVTVELAGCGPGDPNAWKRRSVGFGEVGELRSPSRKVVVMVDEAAFDRFRQLASAGDDPGIAMLVFEGRAYLAVQGTRARVIGSSITGREIRILDGQMINRSGWVPTSYVKPLPPVQQPQAAPGS